MLAAGAIFIGAFLVAVAIIALALPRLRRLAGLQHIREDVPETHQAKAGTPSMGGIPIMVAITIATELASLVMSGRFPSPTVQSALLLGLSYATIGLVDDARKLGDSKSRGLLARYRIGLEVLLAIGFVTWVMSESGAPGANWPSWAGLWGWPDALALVGGVFVIVGGANAVNLTDGLDGLAAGLTCLAALALSAILCLTTHQLPLLPLVMAGAAAGFLVFNSKPAKVWMGDVGSLGLGALLAGCAVAAHLEFLFGIIAAVFVAEALSVIIQVVSFKRTGKRVFRMAPVHHHFELCGWNETRVVTTFWVAGLVAAALAVFLAAALFPSAGAPFR